MQSHPDLQFNLARARLDDRIAEAAHDRIADEARRAAPDFIPSSRWWDGALWASIVGPLLGLGFLAYFAQEIAHATIA